jgi:flagellar basal-body rod protein FlgF
MVRGLYIAGTNMLTAERKIDMVGNNIANTNTYGYKKDQMTIESFNDVLISKSNGSNINMEKPHGEIEIKENNDRYNLHTDRGFFRVNTNSGISNNKDVRFTTDEDGFLSTYYLNSDNTLNYNLGNRLIDINGEEILVGENQYEISNTGQVLIDGEIQNELIKDVGQSVIGTINAGVKNRRLFTDHSSGQMQMTSKPLDIALNGDGFIEVSKDENTLYTRNGALTMNINNELMTMDGGFVQGLNGNIILPDTEVQINQYGEIIKDNEIIDKITISDFTNTGDLRKVGGSYFNTLQDMTGEIVDFEGEVMQGYLESSNVNAIDEMIKLTRISNSYESSQKIITSIEQTLDKVINEVGMVRA